MENLYDLGYEPDQINQIISIENYGFKITKYINPQVPAQKLRELKPILQSSRYSNKEKKYILTYYITENLDVTRYVEMGFNIKCQIDLALEIERKGYDLNLFANKGYDFLTMKLIFKYLKKGIDVSEYVSLGYTEKEILERIRFEKFGLNYDEIKKDYNDIKLEMIDNALQDGYNPMPYINKEHTTHQINSIINALKNKVDVTKVTKVNIVGSVMNIITEGLKENYDITPYINSETNAQLAKILLKSLKTGIDPNKILEFKNSHLAKIAYELYSKDIDASFLKEDFNLDYMNFFKTVAIKAKTKKNIDFNKLKRKDLDIEQLKLALDLMERNLDPKSILKVSLRSHEQGIVYRSVLDGIDLYDYIYEDISSSELSAIKTLLRANYKITKL